MKHYSLSSWLLPVHLLNVLFFFVKADMSVTSLTSHNIVFPQERTIQVEETQNCFNKDEAKSFVVPVLARFFVTDNVLIFGFPRLLLQKQGFMGDGITRVLPNIYRTDQRYVLMSYSIL